MPLTPLGAAATVGLASVAMDPPPPWLKLAAVGVLAWLAYRLVAN